MQNQKFKNIQTFLSTALTSLVITLCGGQALAKDTNIVVSLEQVETAKQAINPTILLDDINRQAIRDLGIAQNSSIEFDRQSYEGGNMPVIELDVRDNADLTIGVLSQDTSDGRTYRDPYSVENIEMNPIYPEGRYVDTLRASAGLDLSSEF